LGRINYSHLNYTLLQNIQITPLNSIDKLTVQKLECNPKKGKNLIEQITNPHYKDRLDNWKLFGETFRVGCQSQEKNWNRIDEEE